jgi:hypothetical protein
VRPPGEVHTFGYVPTLSWHPQLLAALGELGPVSNFDYLRHGATLEGLRRSPALRRSLDGPLVQAFAAAHAARPVDWFFVYAGGTEISAAALRTIRERFGVPIVGMCLDDKQSFVGFRHGDQWAGQLSLAPEFDLSWTSSPVATVWYMLEGSCALCLPEGCLPGLWATRGLPKSVDVVFVGGAYGFRPVILEHLRSHGVSVRAYGPGWPDGFLPDERIAEAYDGARVILGLGGIGHAETLTTVKGRDFDAASSGAAPYLTTYNPDLAEHFRVGEEILCYATRDEMLELVRRCVAEPERARAVARAGRERCLREHTWRHRFLRVLEVLGVIEPAAR